ncbi:hypothetical protein ACFTS5_21000 [Nocardia sp. NPDC056952]|uniref:hypothetical protein n=1 Tax=Nocardia sp. NPDC056952 TaxID=3345979 RepID=UPI0036421D5F
MLDIADRYPPVVRAMEHLAMPVHLHRQPITVLLLDLVGDVVPHGDELRPFDIARRRMPDDRRQCLSRVLVHCHLLE